MKYLTKEWFQLMQKGSYHILLVEVNKAEHFSEEYFKKVYKRQEKQQLDMEKSCYEIFNYERIYENYKGKTSKARVKWLDEFLRKDSNFELAILEQKKNFNENYNRNLRELEDNLPKEILDQVADIRLLALNRCTPKVRKLITTYCEDNIKYVHNTIEKYNTESDKSFKNQNSDIHKKLGFHDSEIISCTIDRKDIIIRISDIDGASKTGFCDITFKNFKLIGEKVEIKNAIWLYEEIYKVELGYELHVLLIKGDSLIEFGVISEDIISTKQVYE